MSPLAKVFVVINLVLSIGFLGIVSTLFSTRAQYKTELSAQASKHENLAKGWRAVEEELSGDIEGLEKNLEVAKRERDQFQVQNERVLGENADLESEKARLKKDLDNALAANTEKDGYLQQKDSEISRLSQRNENLKDETNAAKQEADTQKLRATRAVLVQGDLQQQLQDATALISTLTNERDEFASVVERAREINPDLIARVLVSPPPPAIDGQVVAVRENGIVVLSVGGDDGVENGYEFTVYRRDKFLGKAKVTKVTSDLAGAKILYLSDNGDSLQVGDRVTTRINH